MRCSVAHSGTLSPGSWSLIDLGEGGARRPGRIGPAIVKTGTKKIPGLNGNRRDHHGPLDEELHVVTAKTGFKGLALFISRTSGDFRGTGSQCGFGRFSRPCDQQIEGQFDFAMYMPGRLASRCQVSKETVSIDDNLEMMAAPIAHTALQVARDGTAFADDRLVLAHSIRELHFDRPRIRWSYDDDRKPLDFLLDALANRLARPVPRVARIEGFRIADVAVVGFPCDLGIGLSLRVKQIGRELGLKGVVTMSESGGCVGYVHLPEDYSTTPADEGTRSRWDVTRTP